MSQYCVSWWLGRRAGGGDDALLHSCLGDAQPQKLLQYVWKALKRGLYAASCSQHLIKHEVHGFVEMIYRHMSESYHVPISFNRA